jgi:glutamyl-tRNA reductase
MGVEEKKKKLIALLKDSTLPELSQKTIIENLDKLQEKYLEQIIKGLEKEQEQFKKLEKALKKFEKRKKEEWRKLEKKQRNLAKKFVQETVKGIVKNR